MTVSIFLSVFCVHTGVFGSHFRFSSLFSSRCTSFSNLLVHIYEMMVAFSTNSPTILGKLQQLSQILRWNIGLRLYVFSNFMTHMSLELLKVVLPHF